VTRAALDDQADLSRALYALADELEATRVEVRAPPAKDWNEVLTSGAPRG